MCGIIGYIGYRDAIPILLDGLRRLEYRGYDSAGIALLARKGLFIRKRKGKIRELERLLNEPDPPTALPISGVCGEPLTLRSSSLPEDRLNLGIGHTRWATHGDPSDRNAHPHKDCNEQIAVVHNGIIENYGQLKKDLLSEGHRFSSDTDTEVIAPLIERGLNGELTMAG